ncbi:Uma2 family endonuclease [Streptomyces apocyni]|uniref:Uma2 family endonuclease n=1 Tax=Streptomyces apocyni TaxID=2654677 RepID=UPI0012EAEDC6|nr:Uma2 family endonuclease [Streptomyces apocyni]
MTLMLERPQTIEVPHGSARFEALCRTLLTMDVPEGYRAEIVGGNIVMSPWSKGFYLPIMRSIRTQLEPHASKGHLVDHAPFLFTFPGEERAYGPDIYAAASSAFRTHERYVDGEALSFVAELTSASTRGVGWGDKVPVYGRAGVPVYLLVDVQDETATVFSEPSGKGYRSRTTVPFGSKLHIPAPFDCDLDTAEFELPAEESSEGADA